MNNKSSVVSNDIQEIIKSNNFWSFFFGKQILITGATGFIASYIVEVLLELNNSQNANITVFALARDRNKFNSRYLNHLNKKSLIFLHGDVSTDISQYLPKTLEIVIHAASNASPKFYGSDPLGTLKANTLGTYNLLNICRLRNIESFLFISSAEVYGIPNKIPTGEVDYGYLDPMEIRSCYAESKRMGENMCLSSYYQWSVPIKIARPFHTYGPGMDLNDGRVFADFIKNIVHKENIVINSSGRAQRAFCYLSDAVEAIFCILAKGKFGEAYNIGNDEAEISILRLANKLQGMYPDRINKVILNENKNSNKYLKSKVDRICPNISKINKIGWSPRTDIVEGFSKTVMSYINESK